MTFRASRMTSVWGKSTLLERRLSEQFPDSEMLKNTLELGALAKRCQAHVDAGVGHGGLLAYADRGEEHPHPTQLADLLLDLPQDAIRSVQRGAFRGLDKDFEFALIVVDEALFAEVPVDPERGTPHQKRQDKTAGRWRRDRRSSQS